MLAIVEVLLSAVSPLCVHLKSVNMLLTTLSILLSSVLIGSEAGSVQKSFSLNRRSDGFPYPLDEVDKLEEDALPKFQAYLAKKNVSSHGCTLENAARRKEWYSIMRRSHQRLY